jgi:STAS domain-containing protein
MSNQVATATVALSGLLTIRGVANGREAILKALANSEDISLDVSPNSDADIAGIQLIHSTLLQSRSNAKRISLSAPASGAMLDILTRGGFLEAMSLEDRQFWLHDGVRK